MTAMLDYMIKRQRVANPIVVATSPVDEMASCPRGFGFPVPMTGLQPISGNRDNIRRVADSDFANSFGCEYCKWDDNRLYGHLTQIGSNELHGLILLRCPRCGAFYSIAPVGDDETRRLSQEQALELVDNPESS